jgi:hypothetical protein
MTTTDPISSRFVARREVPRTHTSWEQTRFALRRVEQIRSAGLDGYAVQLGEIEDSDAGDPWWETSTLAPGDYVALTPDDRHVWDTARLQLMSEGGANPDDGATWWPAVIERARTLRRDGVPASDFAVGERVVMLSGKGRETPVVVTRADTGQGLAVQIEGTGKYFTGIPTAALRRAAGAAAAGQ